MRADFAWIRDVSVLKPFIESGVSGPRTGVANGDLYCESSCRRVQACPTHEGSQCSEDSFARLVAGCSTASTVDEAYL